MAERSRILGQIRLAIVYLFIAALVVVSKPTTLVFVIGLLFAPIVAMTITLAAVYAPIGFLSGLTGVLFKEFAFTT